MADVSAPPHKLHQLQGLGVAILRGLFVDHRDHVILGCHLSQGELPGDREKRSPGLWGTQTDRGGCGWSCGDLRDDLK